MSETPIQINLALQHTITSKIKQNGAISFAQFMKMALYEPGLGYYSAGLNKIGVDGDFITASELGSLFARCHATVFADVLAVMNQPVIVELGAGTGQFCVDVLLAMDELNVLPDIYYIVEVSADFKQVQANKIKLLPSHLQSKVRWLNQPPTSPYEGIVFANEVLDALPVEVFKFENHKYHRLMLECNSANKELVWLESWQDFPQEMEQQLHKMDLSLSEGYRSEFLPHLSAWMASITQNLNKGLVLLVDYGYGRSTYYHPQRSTGTLVCQQRHQASFNPYQNIGLQDITAFVDFTAVAEALTECGFALAGYTTQGDFLLASGINQWIDPNTAV